MLYKLNNAQAHRIHVNEMWSKQVEKQSEAQKNPSEANTQNMIFLIYNVIKNTFNYQHPEQIQCNEIVFFSACFAFLREQQKNKQQINEQNNCKQRIENVFRGLAFSMKCYSVVILKSLLPLTSSASLCACWKIQINQTTTTKS